MNYHGSLKEFCDQVEDRLDEGYEIDEEYVKKLNKGKIVIKGNSMFDKEVFANIKEHIIDKKDEKDTAKSPLKMTTGIDTQRELRKLSYIELECIKDSALRKEKIRLSRLSKEPFTIKEKKSPSL